MGILVLNTPAANVTSTVPVAKGIQVKVFQVARTDTASKLCLDLPADATVLDVTRNGSVASDAATTATVTITIANQSGTIATKADDVKASGALTGLVQFITLPNVEPRPLAGDLLVTAVYAETGTASTTGGPWNYTVKFVR